MSHDYAPVAMTEKVEVGIEATHCDTPTDREIYREVAGRAARVIAEPGACFEAIAHVALAGDRHILSDDPETTWPVVVIRACAAAGGHWRRALWPAVALEIAMTAADVFDDLADGEASEVVARFGRGAALTAALGMLSLAGSITLRAGEDGTDAAVTRMLGQLLGEHIAAAADGQARGLSQIAEVTSVVEAYQLAAAKSGPLGELAARLGALVGTTDEDLLRLYGAFGWHLAVCGQLINDATDVLPNQRLNKQDVRDGSPTVPLVFAGSHGTPPGLDPVALPGWEAAERKRVVDEGGVALTEVLAVADRLRAEEALAKLDARGQRTAGLRKLVAVPNRESNESGRESLSGSPRPPV